MLVFVCCSIVCSLMCVVMRCVILYGCACLLSHMRYVLFIAIDCYCCGVRPRSGCWCVRVCVCVCVCVCVLACVPACVFVLLFVSCTLCGVSLCVWFADDWRLLG